MRRSSINACQQGQTPKRNHVIDGLPILALSAAMGMILFGTASPSFNALAIAFISIVLEAIPFMFLGSLIGGLIEAFVSRERMTKHLPKREWLTVCLTAGAGIFFPVCECAVVPVIRRLLGKGLPLSAAVGYLLGGPIVNPIVAASTALAYAFDWRIVVLRAALGYAIAVSVGILMGCIFRRRAAVRELAQDGTDAAAACGCVHHPAVHVQAGRSGPVSAGLRAIAVDGADMAACGCSGVTVTGGWRRKAGAAFRHAVDDFLAVGHYLVIGAFIAALAQAYVARSSLLSAADLPVVSIVLMMALAFLLNLCSEADAFIAASFRGLVPLPAQMAFLLTGPMLDLKLLLMYQGVFQRRAIIVLSALILSAVLGVSIALLGVQWMMPGGMVSWR